MTALIPTATPSSQPSPSRQPTVGGPLLAFTGLDALIAWEPRARPVPATLDDLAATVLETGASALLIDPAGPVPFVIGDDLVAQLSQGRRLVELDDGGFGWAFLDQDA